MKKMLVLVASAALTVAMSMTAWAATGFVDDGSGWKFYYNDGTVEAVSDVGWIEDQNGKRFMVYGDPTTSTMCSINGKLYFFNDDGYMHTGWFQSSYYGSLNPITGESKSALSNSWYYFLPDGSGATGWQQIDGKWYYFGPDSIMLQYATTPDGYYVDGNGECTAEGQEMAKEFAESHERWVAEEQKSVEEKVQEVIDFTNEEREKRGLAPLEKDESLMEAAAIRAEEIEEDFSHVRPNGESLNSLLDECGVSYRRGAGENIVKGVGNAAGAVDSWMKSAGHKANILDSGSGRIGVGYNREIGGWVQLFIAN